MRQQNEGLLKAPAKVIGCLRSGVVRAIVLEGCGMADGGVPHDIPTDLIPFDLRLPNSKFTLVLDPKIGCFVGVERGGEDGRS